MNILITGATGFVGNYLVRQFDPNKYKLFCVVRSEIKAKEILPSFVHIISANHLEEIGDYGIDCVIHLASYLTSRDDEDSIEKILEASIIYGTRILSSLREYKRLKFINIGSFAEYRNGAEKPEAAYFYTAAKLAFRPLLDYFATKGQWDYIHLIPYTIYGAENNQKKLIDYVRESMGSSVAVKMSPGYQVSDFVHIDDVVDCIKFFVENTGKWKGQKGEVYHLGTGRGTSIRELAQLFENKYEKKCNIEWGAWPYRERDVMYAVAPIGKLLDLGWRAKMKLEDNI
jgi:CDP-paratose synthetase